MVITFRELNGFSSRRWVDKLLQLFEHAQNNLNENHFIHFQIFFDNLYYSNRKNYLRIIGKLGR